MDSGSGESSFLEKQWEDYSGRNTKSTLDKSLKSLEDRSTDSKLNTKKNFVF